MSPPRGVSSSSSSRDTRWFDATIGWGSLILDGLWFGALVGALFGLLSHAMLGGRRDFASVGAMRANRYELLVDDEVATEAERLISRIIGESERAAASGTPTRQAAAT